MKDGLVRLVTESGNGESGRELLDDLYWRLTSGLDTSVGLEDDVSAVLVEYKGPDESDQ